MLRGEFFPLSCNDNRLNLEKSLNENARTFGLLFTSCDGIIIKLTSISNSDQSIPRWRKNSMKLNWNLEEECWLWGGYCDFYCRFCLKFASDFRTKNFFFRQTKEKLRVKIILFSLFLTHSNFLLVKKPESHQSFSQKNSNHRERCFSLLFHRPW